MKLDPRIPPVNGGFGDGLSFWVCGGGCESPYTYSYLEDVDGTGDRVPGVWCSGCHRRATPRVGPHGMPCGNCGVLYSVHTRADHEFFDDSLQARINRHEVHWSNAAQMYLPGLSEEL
jgi:hypothetical protein